VLASYRVLGRAPLFVFAVAFVVSVARGSTAPSPLDSFKKLRLRMKLTRHFTARLGLGFVANGFDVVPVRTNDKRCIVVRAVVRAQARRTIVPATRLQSRAIEGFD
jgi:hypothetical protein